MATATTTTRNVERLEIRENIITRDVAEDICPLAERGQSFRERRLVNLGLPMAERRFCEGQKPSKNPFRPRRRGEFARAVVSSGLRRAGENAVAEIM
jgi:hypothetical protein